MASCKTCGYPTNVGRHSHSMYLRQSATAGCLACAVYCDVLRLFDDINCSHIFRDFWEYETFADERGLYIDKGPHRIIMQGREGVSNPWNFPAPSVQNTISTSSQESIQKVAHWLQACITRHTRCGLSLEPLLPDRILDVGLGPSSNDIVLQETTSQRGRYICLSYCWGTSKFLSTTSDNISAHKEGIQLQSLPQTFRDIIFVSRALNIRYIWIDSLCIIQNDYLDWNTQAQKMATIYSNSHLTISASSGASADSGLFSKKLSPVNIRTLSARVVYHLPNNPSEVDISAWPLLSRAWAFQERLLSPRVVHFGPEELIWECNESRDCECGRIEYLPDEIRKSEFHDTVYGKTLNPRDISRLWRRIVVQYSPLALTESSDKFPAIAGVAAVLWRSRNAAYLHGLWNDTFILDLLWRVLSTTNSQYFSERAPSWSWATVDCPILYDERLYSKDDRDIIIYCESLLGEMTSMDKTETKLIQLKCSKLKVEAETVGRTFDQRLSRKLQGMGVRFHADRRPLLDGDYYITRMAQLTSEYLLVLRVHDTAKQIYQRVGLGIHPWGAPMLYWPDATVITII